MNDFFTKRPINPHELGQTLCVVLLKKVGSPVTVSRKELSEAWGNIIDVDEVGDTLKFTITKRQVKAPEKTNAFFEKAANTPTLKTTVKVN